MSDFLYSPERRSDGELAGLISRFVAAVPHVLHELHGTWGSLAVAQVPHEPDALLRDAAAITLVVGSPVARFGALPPRLVHSAPRRQLLHDRLLRGEHVAADLDGAFALLHIDTATGVCCWATDRFAFVPLFRAASGVIGTHVDAVARAAGVQDDVDAVSILDLAANLSCTPPHTLYRNVEQLPAATTHGANYWLPAERSDAFRSVDDAAVALREALAEGIAAAVGDADDVGLLLSAGEDSRVVLAALPSHVRGHAFTYADWENREVRIARKAAQLYGASHHTGLREPDHYATHFCATAALVGSQHHFMDVHGYQFYQDLGLDRLPLMLGGYSADTLLKRALKRDESSAWRTIRLQGISESLHCEVDDRRAQFRARLRQFRPTTSAEWLRVWPISIRRHGANVAGNRRMFRTWEAFHATAVLDVGAAVPSQWKESRRLFRKSMRPLLRRSWWLPHAEYRFPYFAPRLSMALVPLLGVARGVRAVLHGEMRARQRPWPKSGAVAAAPVMLERERLLLQQSPLLPALGVAPEAVQSWYALRRLFFAQLAYTQQLASE